MADEVNEAEQHPDTAEKAKETCATKRGVAAGVTSARVQRTQRACVNDKRLKRSCVANVNRSGPQRTTAGNGNQCVYARVAYKPNVDSVMQNRGLGGARRA